MQSFARAYISPQHQEWPVRMCDLHRTGLELGDSSDKRRKQWKFNREGVYYTDGTSSWSYYILLSTVWQKQKLYADDYQLKMYCIRQKSYYLIICLSYRQTYFSVSICTRFISHYNSLSVIIPLHPIYFQICMLMPVKELMKCKQPYLVPTFTLSWHHNLPLGG